MVLKVFLLFTANTMYEKMDTKIWATLCALRLREFKTAFKFIVWETVVCGNVMHTCLANIEA